MNKLRDGLPELPEHMKGLPIDERGYPVPWFVAWVDGKPEFRTADGEKLNRAVNQRLCWVCGNRLGANLAFVLGPMCAVNRNTAEPPCHLSCALFAATACPFLTNPDEVRREHNLPEEAKTPAGFSIKRNPGCVLIWRCRSYEYISYYDGLLFTPGEPLSLYAYRRGKLATYEEVWPSIDSGLYILANAAKAEGPDAEAELRRLVAKAQGLLSKLLPHQKEEAHAENR
jgi:hypothetical protein